jgi:hypothetical protein
MNTIIAGELNKGQLLIVKNIDYSITGISTCKPFITKTPQKKYKKIHIVAFNTEINKKIEMVYPETYKFILEDDGKINLDKAHYFTKIPYTN